jgi:rare lipoprotein A
MILLRTKTSANIYYKVALRLLALMLVAFMLAACGGGNAGKSRYGGGSVKVASWYGPGFHGKRTASGEVYNMYAMTVAHKTLPFGTRLRLTNVANGKSVNVTVTDRGPFVWGRDIDLSKGVAMKLGTISSGTGRVRMQITGRDMRYAKYIKSGKVYGGQQAAVKENYTIQVAAFSDKKSADTMLDLLKKKYSKAYMIEKWVDGKRYFRVRIGKFRSERSAKSYARKLSKDGYKVRVSPYGL